jgi:phage terminase Nu1 subunit (DNA packaging protein)
MDLKADILKDALLQFVKLSDQSPFLDIPKYLHEKNEEIEQLKNKKQKLKEEIQTIEQEKIASEEKVKSSLKNVRTTLVNIDIFVNTRDELESYGIHD